MKWHSCGDRLFLVHSSLPQGENPKILKGVPARPMAAPWPFMVYDGTYSNPQVEKCETWKWWNMILRLSTNPEIKMRFLAFWGPPSGQRDQAHVLHSGTSYQFQSIACECSARKRDTLRELNSWYGVFFKWGIPKTIGSNTKGLILDDVGYPYFRKPPYIDW